MLNCVHRLERDQVFFLVKKGIKEKKVQYYCNTVRGRFKRNKPMSIFPITDDLILKLDEWFILTRQLYATFMSKTCLNLQSFAHFELKSQLIIVCELAKCRHMDNIDALIPRIVGGEVEELPCKNDGCAHHIFWCLLLCSASKCSTVVAFRAWNQKISEGSVLFRISTS